MKRKLPGEKTNVIENKETEILKGYWTVEEQKE